MFVETMFAFSFGGQADFSKIYNVGDQFELNFYPCPVGIGFAIRNGVEADLRSAKHIKFTISSSKPVEGIVEFKTLNSGGSPEKSQRISPYALSEEFYIEILKLSSPLKEIVIYFSREDHPIWRYLNVTISNVEII